MHGDARHRRRSPAHPILRAPLLRASAGKRNRRERTIACHGDFTQLPDGRRRPHPALRTSNAR
ncbi:MAG: hypothetical protein ACK55I_34260, partial [bacterium]